MTHAWAVLLGSLALLATSGSSAEVLCNAELSGGIYTPEITWNLKHKHTMQPICGGEGAESTTCLVAFEGEYVLEKLDAFGDGWHGESITFSKPNAQGDCSYLLPSGSVETETILGQQIYACCNPTA